MKLFPFSGIRYTASEEAGALAAPPFDQIDDALRDRLHARPHQFAHLTRPAAGDDDPHRAAARRHRRWMAAGLVRRDREPAFYPYEICLAERGRRLGLCGLVGLEPSHTRVIRPHERTVEKTVDERLSLLRATRLDLEPILLLAEESGELNRLLEEDIDGRPPIVIHRDLQENDHCLYHVDREDRIAAYRRLLAASSGVIADGHHRYTVAQRFAREAGARPGSAAACKLAVVTSLASPGLRIDPIHRQLTAPVAVEAAARLCSQRRSMEARSGEAIAAAVAAASQPALAIATAAERVEIWEFDPALAPPSLTSHLRHLAVGWLHGAVLIQLGLGEQAATDGTVGYRSDPEQLYADLGAGRVSVGFWLPPMTARDFSLATAGGQLLPPKSTRFLPKVASGLVWASHDDPSV